MVSFVHRAALLQISAYGPAFGSAAALAAIVIGLGLSAAGVGGSELQPVAFNDSLLVGILGVVPSSLSSAKPPSLTGTEEQEGSSPPSQAACSTSPLAPVWLC